MNEIDRRLACPQCGAIAAQAQQDCSQCGLPLAWIANAGRFGEALQRPRVEPAAKRPSSPPVIEGVLPGVIPLDVNAPVVLGRRIVQEAHAHEVPDARVELEHCVIVRQPPTRHFWLADLGTRHGTWVNGRQATATRLTGGDVVQLGGFAWVFNESDGLLAPIAPIEGVDLRLEGVKVEVATRAGSKQLLAELHLHVRPGQFVAIAGESGTGKSTLMKTILGQHPRGAHGQVRVGGYDRDEEAEEYRARLGYVPQSEIVHDDLPVLDAIYLAARLRRKPASSERIAQLLRRLDVPRERWDATPRRLSGGERQRVRIAAELVAGPQLLLLDEPAAGLDQGREIRLMKLLRGLCIQGCTVLVVTHGLRHLEYFDRVLILQRGGVLQFDGSPAELQECIPSGEFTDLDLSEPPALRREGSLPPPAPEHAKTRKTLFQRLVERGGQFTVLFRRELRMLQSAPWRRVAVPLAFMPAFFATALHVAVPRDNLPLLGFFAILACIWMGSSLSLLSIVGERTVLDHERLLFLHPAPYLLAKGATLGWISAIQCVLLVVWLSLLRAMSGGQMLLDPPWTAFHVALVGWAAMSVGLFISAAVGESRALANFLLPLFMIVQIVFSVQVAGEGDLSLRKAYGEFHIHGCEGPYDCPRRAEHWLPADGAWLCHKCFAAYRHCAEQDGEHDAGLPAALDCMKHRLAPERPADPAVVEYNANRPNRLAAAVSYLTTSRYGDIALRSFAYERGVRERSEGVKDPYTRHGYARWRWTATGVLATMIAGFWAATWIILLWRPRE